MVALLLAHATNGVVRDMHVEVFFNLSTYTVVCNKEKWKGGEVY